LENLSLAVVHGVRARVAAVGERFGLTATLDVPVSELELPQRQRIELLRALCQEPTVLILDEPTTFLPPTAIEPFLAMVRALADQGLAVMLITHRLDEARSIADDVTVIRAGRVVDRFDRDSMPANEELAMAMVGAAVVEPTTVFRSTTATVLEARDMCVDDGARRTVDGVSLTLGRGEILGVAGVDGNGQLELLEGIAGLHGLSAGSLRFGGDDIAAVPYSRRARMGIQFVSGERRRDGIVPTFTIAEHFSYALGPKSTEGLDEILTAYAVNPPRPSARAEHLSGGNQQKMILARALQRPCEVLLLSYPTQGLDVLATAQLHRLLVDRAKAGMAIVIASADLDELLTISHRVVVMNRGRIAGEQICTSFDRQELAAWFTGSDPR
jgi:simple sugar transport system ATP-binding protein